MEASITLLWTDATEDDVAILRAVGTAHGMTVRHVRRDGLASSMFAALARGALIVAATTDLEATQALGLGADEVVRLGPVSRVALERSIHRSTARAKSRATREDTLRREIDSDRAALSLLAVGIGHELAAPLATASDNTAVLKGEMGQMLDAHEKLVGWALLAAPLEECRRIRDDTRDGTHAEVRSILADLDEAVGRAKHVMRTLARTFGQQSSEGTTHVRDVAEDLVGLLENELGRVACFEANVSAVAEVAISRAALLWLLGTLMAHALDAVRGLESGRARIALRTTAHDGTALIEIEHNGEALPAQARATILEHFLGSSRASTGGLDGVRARAQRLGGELLMVSERETTTLRLLLPLAESAIDLSLAPVALARSTPTAKD